MVVDIDRPRKIAIAAFILPDYHVFLSSDHQMVMNICRCCKETSAGPPFSLLLFLLLFLSPSSSFLLNLRVRLWQADHTSLEGDRSIGHQQQLYTLLPLSLVCPDGVFFF